jgi:hypothetical protein
MLSRNVGTEMPTYATYIPQKTPGLIHTTGEITNHTDRARGYLLCVGSENSVHVRVCHHTCTHVCKIRWKFQWENRWETNFDTIAWLFKTSDVLGKHSILNVLLKITALTPCSLVLFNDVSGDPATSVFRVCTNDASNTFLAVYFLLGNSKASEFYMPTFRNTLFHLHRQVDVKNDWVWDMLGYLYGKRFGSKITQKKAHYIHNTA